MLGLVRQMVCEMKSWLCGRRDGKEGNNRIRKMKVPLGRKNGPGGPHWIPEVFVRLWAYGPIRICSKALCFFFFMDLILIH